LREGSISVRLLCVMLFYRYLKFFLDMGIRMVRGPVPRGAATRYVAFVDPSGGSGEDSFSLAIAHRERSGADSRVIVNAVRERKPPFSPSDVVAEFSKLLKSYHITKVTGDRWAAGFAAEAFKQHGIRYQPSVKTKSDLYVELLPLLNSGRVVLPRNERLVAQLVALERRTSRGTGRDSIDHPPRAHDDLANAAAGACVVAAKPGYDSSFDWVSGHDARDTEVERALAVRRAYYSYVSTGGYTKPPWAY
jgi:hypothetical protein